MSRSIEGEWTMKVTIALALIGSVVTGCTATPEGPSSSTSPTVGQSNDDVTAADARALLALPDVARMVAGVALTGGALRLGEPFPLRYVHASSLLQYDGKADGTMLSGVVADRVYPVTQNGQVVASITVHETNGEWQTAAIGQGNASGKLVSLRDALRATHAADSNAYEIVHVIGLNDRFIGHSEGNVRYLTPVQVAADATPRLASSVLGELAIRARSQSAHP
jgi:hypothetical protein